MSTTLEKVKKTHKWVSIFLIALSVLLLIFGLVSGSEAYGGGVSGIIKNSPNATPWLVLLVLSGIAYVRPVFGGFLIVIVGLGLFFFLNFRANFFFSTFVLTLIIPLIGFVLLMCGYYIKKADAQ